MLEMYLFLSIVILVVILGTWFLFPFLLRKLEENRLSQFCADNGHIVLTFDDGPCPETTPQILDILKEKKIKASFFALGQHANQERGLARMIIAEGHDFGHHSEHHINAWKSSPLTALIDIQNGQRTIASLKGAQDLFRAPYGKMTLLTMLYVWFQNIKSCWWTIDPKDSRENPLSHNKVLAQIRNNRGGVILLHDHKNPSYANHTQYVLSLIYGIVMLAEKMDLTFLPMSELLSRKNSNSA
jgi:peptidoglycan/xylan/chitin deacetylase (PgdA/CDA1 family)